MKMKPELQLTSQARFRGALLGLACGDAVGTTVEFAGRGTFMPVTDMVGGGPFGLRRGEWTDDTSMARRSTSRNTFGLGTANATKRPETKQGWRSSDIDGRNTLWCFLTTESFDGAILTAANLGDDADTTAAICGQVAGAYYGESGIPDHWLQHLFMAEEIRALADGLRLHHAI
jgi:ADP-ribosylglycohydrolase